MNYLLDTNACIALINDRPTTVRRQLEKALAARSVIFVSSIAAFELWYGVAKSARKEINTRLVETFFAGPVTLLQFEEGDARAAGKIRAELETKGTPIGAYDLLIAGQAAHHGLHLVTANAREFRRIRALHLHDWARS